MLLSFYDYSGGEAWPGYLPSLAPRRVRD